jgi:hypothetical protein
MPLVVPSVSDSLILNFIFGKQTAPINQTLRLFKNDYIPTKTSILSEISECTENGYSPIILNESTWIINTISGVTSANYTEQTFTFTELAVVYGFYVTVNIDSIDYLLYMERFSDGPYEIPSAGGSVSISLNFAAS